MNTIEKLHRIKELMGYFELVSVSHDEKFWRIRNGTDEGLGGEDEFVDTNLELLLDRVISYYENGPDKEITKASHEVSKLFNRKVKIYGDTISVLYDYIYEDTKEIDRIENLMTEYCYHYGKYDLSFTYNLSGEKELG